jgi:hypothetical protein
MYTPPGMPRSRSFTRFTMRVGLLHLGQSVLLDVSITFLRSAVLAILAMETLSPLNNVACVSGLSHPKRNRGSAPTKPRRPGPLGACHKQASRTVQKNVGLALAILQHVTRETTSCSCPYYRVNGSSDVLQTKESPQARLYARTHASSGKSLDC